MAEGMFKGQIPYRHHHRPHRPAPDSEERNDPFEGNIADNRDRNWAKKTRLCDIARRSSGFKTNVDANPVWDGANFCV